MFNSTPQLETAGFLLRPIGMSDEEGLYSAMSDPEIWAQHPNKSRHKRDSFNTWFTEALENGALVLVDKLKKEMIGSSRYYEISLPNDVSIGYTFLVRKHWGGHTNRILKKLMIEYAQQYFTHVWLHIAKDNTRSRKAAEKIGARLSHEGKKYGLAYCWYLAPETLP